jgi:hypothetical protein
MERRLTEQVRKVVHFSDRDLWEGGSSLLKIREKSNSGVSTQLEYWKNGILE